MVQRTVHNLDAKYGVSIRTKRGWKFIGILCLSQQRTTREPGEDLGL
jgi:hypothetical protein